MHDPIRQADFLRQTLAHAKRPFGIMVGAGCPAALSSQANPAEALIPDIAGITRSISASLAGAPCAAAFRTLCDELERDGNAQASVEDYLTLIRSLRQVAGAQTVRGLNRGQLDDLDTRICDAIVSLVDKKLPSGPTPYHSLAQWTSSTDRPDAVEVFTTNYDLLLEQAMESSKVPLFDGFVGAYQPFFDTRAIEQDLLPSRWCRVWKLHGSINWHLEEGSTVTRTTQTQPGSRIIHPSHLKYDESRRMPYLALIDRFRTFLRKPSAVLVICGYSFRDDHLNEVIGEALHSNPTLVVFALMYGDLAPYNKAQHVAQSHGNMSLMARDAAIIGRRSGPWRTAEKTENLSGYIPAVEVVNGAEDRLPLRFELGNFKKFGEFLDAIVGVTGSAS